MTKSTSPKPYPQTKSKSHQTEPKLQAITIQKQKLNKNIKNKIKRKENKATLTEEAKEKEEATLYNEYPSIDRHTIDILYRDTEYNMKNARQSLNAYKADDQNEIISTIHSHKK
eukprot:194425_1